jgi:hypothetical protein
LTGARAVAVFLVPAAVGVAALLLVLRLHFQPPTIPPYAIVDADPSSVVDLRHGGRFELTLRPEREVSGAVGARAFLVRDGAVRPWDPPFAVDRDGSLRIEGPVDTLFADVPPGKWEVAVAVGRPENLPTAPLDVLRARDAGPTDRAAAWRLVREQVRLGG